MFRSQLLEDLVTRRLVRFHRMTWCSTSAAPRIVVAIHWTWSSRLPPPNWTPSPASHQITRLSCVACPSTHQRPPNNRNELGRLLEASRLCQPVPEDVHVDRLFTDCDTVLRDTADKLAPVHVVRPTPWFDNSAEQHVLVAGVSSVAMNVRETLTITGCRSMPRVAGCI